jgi:hypothetical protein
MHRLGMAVVAAVAAGGCAGGQPRTETFVRQARIDAKSVVIERCRVRAKSDVIAIGRCWEERLPLPVVTRIERVAVPAPAAACPAVAPARPAVEAMPAPSHGTAAARAGAAATITTGLRDALHRCAAAHAAGESVRLRFIIDGSGVVSAVELDRSNPPMVSCATAALGGARFPPASRGTSFSMSLRAAPVDLGEVAP